MASELFAIQNLSSSCLKNLERLFCANAELCSFLCDHCGFRDGRSDCIAVAVNNNHKVTIVVLPESHEATKLFLNAVFCTTGSYRRILTMDSKLILSKIISLFGTLARLRCHMVDVSIGASLLGADSNADIFTLCSFLGADPPTDRRPLSTVLSIAHLAHQLHCRLIETDLWDLFVRIEMRVTPLLVELEAFGICVDRETLGSAQAGLRSRIKELEKTAYRLSGMSFSLNSHQQIRRILFDRLKLHEKIGRSALTPVGQQLSTSESVLTQLVEAHPLPAVILEYRKLEKIRSTHVEGLLPHVRRHVACDDGNANAGGRRTTTVSVIRSQWDQLSAVTGRLVSAAPNLTAIPKLPVEISPGGAVFAPRSVFVSRPGCSLLAADFRQIEFRLFAHLSGDEELIGIFCGPGDIFCQLASQWLNKSVDAVSGEERDQTKRMVYSVMYGVGRERLAEYLKVSSAVAQRHLDSFLIRFPSIRRFTRHCVDQCRRRGYMTSLFGRRRLLPAIRSGDASTRLAAERQAVNFPVQASAADLCKLAMVCLSDRLALGGFSGTRLLLQLHDEVVYDVPDSDLHAVAEIVKSTMSSVETMSSGKLTLSVPIEASLSVGKNWGQMTRM